MQQRKDHTELMVVHLLVGVVTSLALVVLSGLIAGVTGSTVHPVWTALGASVIVLTVAGIMAWTPVLHRFELDFRGEPVEDRIVVTVSYGIAALVAPMLADAIWSSV